MSEKYYGDNAYETPGEGLRPANYDDHDVFGHEENHQVGLVTNPILLNLT